MRAPACVAVPVCGVKRPYLWGFGPVFRAGVQFLPRILVVLHKRGWVKIQKSHSQPISALLSALLKERESQK